MNNLRADLRRNPIIKALSSINITVICLSLLFILTLWGTIAQVDQGLYQAQNKFFNSWYFLVFNFFPFPGTRLVLWVLFLNLVCVSITRFVYRLSHLGIIVIHVGLLLYFVAAFVTFHVVEESNVTLREGQGTNLSTAYHEWEMSVWQENGANERNVVANDLQGTQANDVLFFDEFGFNVTIKKIYHNANAFVEQGNLEELPLNDSGITSLVKAGRRKEPEKNIPGGIFELNFGNHPKKTILLYGGETKPTTVELDDSNYQFIIRRKRYPLPFVITLKDFTKEVHPGTEIASKYQSLVQIEHDQISRDVLIYMNEPLRFKDYTLYQASYAIDRMGRELSTLAVVKNSGRLLPYIASFVTFFGLAIHFLMIAFSKKRRRI